MSGTRDTMELREPTIRGHYDAALALLTGFDHAPRLAKAMAADRVEQRSPGLGSRPRFRSTTPGLVTRPTTRPGGVRLIERIEGLGDGLVSPLQASVLGGLRRALAIALAMGETFGDASGLVELKQANLEARLPDPRRVEFAELLAAEALIVLHVLANATAFLLAPQLGTVTVEVGAVDEVLTDNAPLALQGALWELDQDIAALASAFLDRFARENRRPSLHLPGSVREQLEAYAWPGNVRELQNVLERAAILSPGRELRLPAGALPTRGAERPGRPLVWDAQERAYLERLLHHTQGKIAGAEGAAALAQLPPSTLLSRLERLGLHPRDFRKS